VGHSSNAFCKESFIDELAHLTRQDPLAFRLRHLAPTASLARVLRTVAKMAGWQDQKPEGGRALGIAAHESFGSAVAQIAEVQVTGTQLRVTRVWCAVDCGLAVNPDSVRAQMESGIIFGLSAALHGEITLQDGAVEQSNFHDYPVLRITECPEIHVDVAAGGEIPSGVGEPGVPPIAPALANAVFRACGQRLRRLPLQLSV
jgi:CO/xanthine dehydrogenase Mo-binding subunit